MDSLAMASAAHGMENQERLLATIGNNIANINTTAYKTKKLEFADLMYHNVKMMGGDAGDGSAAPAGVQIGNGSQVIATTSIFTQGDVNQTGRDLDMALQGDGFFKVELPGGGEAYTRDGSWKVNADGDIVTSTGYKISGAPNVKNYTAIYVSETGDITVQTGEKTETTKLSLVRFSSPTGLENMGNNLYKATTVSGEPQVVEAGRDGAAKILSGYLEMSNVSMVREMTQMIVAQRVYDANSKTIQTADNMQATASQLKRS